MKRPSLFGTTNSLRFPRASSGSEVDLRSEFDTLMFGSATEIGHSYPGFLRTMRRDTNGNPIKCSCFEAENTSEPDPSCSYCLGEGYIWTETWLYYRYQYVSADSGMARKWMNVAPGLERTDYMLFYLRYDTIVTLADKLITIALDKEGKPITPYVRTGIFKPSTSYELRSDNGRVEFMAVFCKEEDAWRRSQ
jgi:hypothetical protein